MASTLNTTCLDNILCSRLESARADNSSESLATRALAAPLRTTDRAVSVATVDDLPDLYNSQIEDGQLMYVESINVPVISSCCQWIGLDQRLLRNDINATLWSWGRTVSGGLGNNVGSTKRSSPGSVVGGLTWCQVAVGQYNGIAIKTDGTLWAWGGNNCGIVGDGSTTNRSSPVSVIGGFTDWCQISVSDWHAVGLRKDGSIWAWGASGLQGSIGDGTSINRSSPVSVIGGFTWCRISTIKDRSTLAIRDNGSLWAWGDNSSGVLGDNTVVCRSSPVSVVGGFTNWCQVSTGASHSVGLLTTGVAYAWGSNSDGELGTNNVTSRSSPVAVVGGYTWCQIEAGSQFSLAIRNNGTLWAWGSNLRGQLGDGTVTYKSSPISVAGGFTDWCQIATGSQFALGIRTNGTLWAWGTNCYTSGITPTSSGELGDGTSINRSSPVSVLGGFTDWCQVSAGAYQSMAIRIY